MLFIETHSTDPYFNLAFEEYILLNKTEGDWLILWQNDNTVVIGLNQNPLEEIDGAFVKANNIHLVRRSTGGGAVYHDMGNLNYSFITGAASPETLSFEQFTLPVCRALASMGLPAQPSGRNDITVYGKKISGSAQRLSKGRVLHHGTLLFDSHLEVLASALKPDPAKFISKSAKSVQSRVCNIRPLLAEDFTLNDFRQLLLKELTAGGMEQAALSGGEIAAIEANAGAKYRSWEWNWGHSPKYLFNNKRRFEGGTLEISMNIKGGRIADISFHGDFLAMCGLQPAVEALKKTLCREAELRQALNELDIPLMFGSITIDQIVSTILNAE